MLNGGLDSRWPPPLGSGGNIKLPTAWQRWLRELCNGIELRENRQTALEHGNFVDRYQAILILNECSGDDIWSLEYCSQKGIPEAWIQELLDCYESGFQRHSETIYHDGKLVAQFEGIRDVDLACKLGVFLGAPVSQIVVSAFSRSSVVQAIQEAVEEG